MSIAVLAQVYDEARRLAVAGSVVARGDFRLKKLVQPLEQAGAKAPVFAKVAECAKTVIEGPESTSAESLLELTSLVSAVLYTQGETGLAGTLEPIETTDLGGTMAQTSARLLKPLLEALTNTGSGRLELVRDAHQRDAFRDLRLVKPALNGLDDPYPEIAEFLADKVLPLYGKAILPELRARFDLKGTKGHPRRLKLMQQLDAVGTREIVKQALEAGSKEVKVAAISCLGAQAEDLSYLIEQASAKTQDVREAAYRALATIDDPAATAVLEKAITGKDLHLAASAIQRSQTERLSNLLVKETQKEQAALAKAKEKKSISEKAGRLCQLIGTLPTQGHAAADALILDLFKTRQDLVKYKGDSTSGSDVVLNVIQRMMTGSKALQTALADAHAELDSDFLDDAFEAARNALPAAEVYNRFAPYLKANVEDKKKGKETLAKRNAVLGALNGDNIYWFYYRSTNRPALDPRWLDLAVEIKHLGLVHATSRPGHAGAEAFVKAEFDTQFKKAKSHEALQEVLTVMVHLPHPNAAEAFVATYEKTIGKANVYTYWYTRLITELPKSAIPLLEAVVPKLKEREADNWLEAIQELRDKK